MAKTIATISGVALRPGVSLNRRLYTAPMIEKAVSAAQERIRAGDEPMVMLTHHGAGDDSRQIAARLTGLALGEDGSARFEAAIGDTSAGRDVAALIDRGDGEPHLKGTSIRGFWTGLVRKVKGDDGKPVETADGLELDGLDFTRSPGVHGAAVDTFAWADRSGRSETTERVPIFESVQEARVTITEETPAAPPGVREALRAVLGAPDADEAATPAMSKRTSGLSGGGRVYADPGYQADKKQRYDITTKAVATTAWRYINQKAKAAKYTGPQLKQVRARIIAALKKFGVSVAAEGWTLEPFQVTEALAEYYGDSSRAGSWCITACNGPVSLTLSCCSGMDPADLDVILRAAADAACKAIAMLDPDMDGDIDLPGAPGADTDHDGGSGEAAPDDPLGETETDPAASPAAATTQGTEDPVMTEATTPAAAAAPAIDPKVLAEAVGTAMAQQDEARRARKAAKRAAQESAQAEAAKAATEAAAAQAAASAALGQGIPATAGATVSETAEQRMARLSELADKKLAERLKAEGLAAEETDEQILDRLLEEKMVPFRQARAESGGVQRKGLAALESIADGAPGTQKMLQECSNDDLARLAAAAFPPAAGRH